MRWIMVLVLSGCSFIASIGFKPDYAEPDACDHISGAVTADVVGAVLTGGIGGFALVGAATSSGDSAAGVAVAAFGAVSVGFATLLTLSALYGHHANGKCLAGQRAFQLQEAGSGA